MWVKDLKSKGELPQEFLDLLPEVCECGGDLAISASLTGLHCANPWCLSRVVKRAEQMLADLGVLGLGEKNLEKFFITYNTRNPLDLFALEEGMLIYQGASEVVSGKIISQIQAKKEMFLWELVYIANIPGVRTTAKTLLANYENLTDFYDDLEAGKEDFIKEHLNIGQWTSLAAFKIFKSFMTYKNDLLEGEKYISKKVLKDIEEIEICISEGVSGFKSKPEFVGVLNKEFGDKYFFVNNSSITKRTKYFIWEGVNVTSKATKASKMQIPTFKGLDFIEYFRREIY